MQMVDPPVIGEGNNPYKRYVYRAFHYSSLFSFLGDEELSNYYDKMAKRLSGMIDNTEMLEKEILYNELNRYAPSIIIHGRRYVGHIFGTQEDYYFFLGVDKQLLSFHGFMNYENIEEQHFMFRDNGVLIISPDGVIVGLIKNLNDYFEDEPDVNKVLSYDNIAITDIDTIRDSSFKRYIKYLLDKCSKSTEWLSDGSLQANINGKNRIFHFYHSRNVRLHYPSKRNIEVLMNYESNMNGTLVTNLEIPTGLLNYPVVDRRDLEQITSKMADSNIIKEVFAR